MIHRRTSCLILRALLLIMLAGLAPINLSAVEMPAAQSGNGSLPSIENLKQRITQLETANGQSGTDNKELLNYRQTLNLLQQAEEERLRTAAYKEAMDNADQRLNRLRDELQKTRKQSAPKLKSGLALEALSQRYNELLLDLQQAQSRLQDLENEQAGERFRPELSGVELAETKRKLDEVENQLSGETVSKLPSHQRELLAAEQTLLENRVRRLEMERLSHIHRMDQLGVSIKLAQEQLRRQEQLGEALQNRIAALQSQEVEETQQRTQRAQEQAAGKHPLIRYHADENAKLSDKLGQLADSAEQLTNQLQQTITTKDTIRQRQERVQQQIIIGSLDERPGRLLQRQRRELPRLDDLNRSVERLRSQIATHRLESFQVESQWQQLQATLEHETSGALKPPEMSASEWQEVETELNQLMENRLLLLEKLRDAYARLEKLLSDLSAQQLQLYDRVEQYADLLDRHLLWIPSTERLGGNTFRNAAAALAWFFSAGSWQQIGQALLQGWQDQPYRIVLMLVLFGALISTRTRMRRVLAQIVPDVGNVTRDRFTHTMKAFAITVLQALPWPMLMAGMGWWLTRGSDAEFINAVSTGLRRVAVFFLAIQTLHYLFIKDGLADVHFRWNPVIGALFRRHLRWLVPVLIPLAFIVGVFEWVEQEAYTNALGRLALIAGLLVAALFFHHILNPWNGVTSDQTLTSPHRPKVVWYPLALGTCFGLSILAFEGYHYSALSLERMLFGTLFAGILVYLIYQLMVRWLLVAERRLALARARAKRQAAQEARVTKEAAEAAGEGIPELSEFEEVNLTTINEQTRRLLRVGSTLLFGIMLYLIWEPLVPALSGLNTVSLWQYQGDEGTLNTISLWEALLALVVLVLTLIGGRNLPGLLEIALLQPLNLDLGNRYAVSTISRYVIYGGGSLLVLNLLGLQWSDVQWLVAAMGVGLGFGLKEIFANFFSGLLILFERPIRIGDTVTIGDISGTVSRIRIRATTITDWDNKELVVPNKNFITDPLVNWTLSDPITRIVIRIGIAYGSDTEKAHQVMTEVVEQHPDVLKEPRPTIFFVGFGDSALNFDIRVFVNDNLKRMPLLHDLHMSLNRALAEQGIEIPFPQRDLHLRSVDPKISWPGSKPD